MLYVFLVEPGTMLRLDMALAMESVASLQSHVTRLCNIPEDKQVLLISGGETLDRNAKVGKYSAGTDTNPIYLFSKSTIEANSPPSPSINYGRECDLSDELSEIVLLPATHDTVSAAYKLAKQTYEADQDRMEACEQLIHDQHLQQQGWFAVIANLEDITSALQQRLVVFQENYQHYIQTRKIFKDMLSRVPEVLQLLSRIPLVQCLQQCVTYPADQSVDLGDTSGPVTLLDWISQQDPQHSLSEMVEQCQKVSEKLNSQMIEQITEDAKKVFKDIDLPHMKAVKGLESRLYQLDQWMNVNRAIMDKQAKFVQKFTKQLESGTKMDCETLAEFWKNFKKDLMEVAESHNQIKALKKKCCRAKEELSQNLHVRLRFYLSSLWMKATYCSWNVDIVVYACHRRNRFLKSRWVMYVEQQISEMVGRLMVFSEKLKRLQKRLAILQQVHDSPHVYAGMVMEVVRRRMFSTNFLKWASRVAEESSRLQQEEISRRQQFYENLGHHFLQALFQGFDDVPPHFAAEAPRLFDKNLPEITVEDIEHLRSSVPELRDIVQIPSETAVYERLCIQVPQSLLEELNASQYGMLGKSATSEFPETSAMPGEQGFVSFQTIMATAELSEYSYHDIFMKPQPVKISDSQGCPVAESLSETLISVVECKTEPAQNTKSPSEGDPVQGPEVRKQSTEDGKSSEMETNNQSVDRSNDSVSSKKQQSKSHLTSDTSPEVETSQEFTTADFYIDESMPSSIGEATSQKGSTTTDKEDLQKQLQEKCEFGEKLSKELQTVRAKLSLADERLRALKDLVERSLPLVREQLFSLQHYVSCNQREFLEFFFALKDGILQAIEAQLETAEKQSRIALASIQQEHEAAAQSLLEKLATADLMLEQLKDENSSLEERLKEACSECESRFQESQNRQVVLVENYEQQLKELAQKHNLDIEVEIERTESEFQKIIEEQQKLLCEKSSELDKYCAQNSLLTQENMQIIETLTYKFAKEKENVVKQLEEKFDIEKREAVTTTETNLREQHKFSVDALTREFECKLQETCTSLRLKLDSEHKQLMALFQTEMETARHEDEEKLKTELLLSKEAELMQLRDELSAHHADELASCQQELKAAKLELLQRSPPPAVDAASQTSDSVISMDEHKHILRDQELVYQEKIQDLEQAMLESVQIQKYELNEVISRLEQEKEQQLNSLRTSLMAEKQMVFNQALSKITEEKDQVINILKKEISEVLSNYQLEQEICEQTKVDMAHLREEKVNVLKTLAEKEEESRKCEDELQLQKQQTIAYQEQLSTLSQTGSAVGGDATFESSVEMTEEAQEKLTELQKTIKVKDEEIEKLQQKMGLSMGASQFLEQDKVSITSFHMGDLVLLCLDEDHGHYVVFTVGNTLHFLHPDCLDNLGLKVGLTEPKKAWGLGVITDKEYCQAKKPQNRFKVPVGTRFYRVKAKPWPKDPRLNREALPSSQPR